MRGFAINMEKTAHCLLRSVRLELDLPPHPVGTLFGNGFLLQFVAELNLKIGAVKVTLTMELGNEKLALLLLGLVFDKGRRGENETQLPNALQLLLQCRKSIDGEGGRRYRHTRSFGQFDPQVVYHSF